jgi:chlorite dismutase
MALDIRQREDEETVDLTEKGRSAGGVVISSDRRLYMQFLAFSETRDSARLVAALAGSGLLAVLYEDINDPRGVGLLTLSEEPDTFLGPLRQFLNSEPFASLAPKPEYTMLGRTYAIGYEQDLERTLIGRPRERVLDPALPWAIWYPLRRAGSFEQLTAHEQRTVLMEHGGIGRAFGEAGHGYDIRLA